MSDTKEVDDEVTARFKAEMAQLRRELTTLRNMLLTLAGYTGHLPDISRIR